MVPLSNFTRSHHIEASPTIMLPPHLHFSPEGAAQLFACWFATSFPSTLFCALNADQVVAAFPTAELDSNCVPFIALRALAKGR